jgi:hypothetical protein
MKGVWGEDGAKHVRNITWEVENPRQLVDKYAGRKRGVGHPLSPILQLKIVVS